VTAVTVCVISLTHFVVYPGLGSDRQTCAEKCHITEVNLMLDSMSNRTVPTRPRDETWTLNEPDRLTLKPSRPEVSSAAATANTTNHAGDICSKKRVVDSELTVGLLFRSRHRLNGVRGDAVHRQRYTEPEENDSRQLSSRGKRLLHKLTLFCTIGLSAAASPCTVQIASLIDIKHHTCAPTHVATLRTVSLHDTAQCCQLCHHLAF
jgi:hypothetical protein